MNNTDCEAEKRRQEASEKSREVEQQGHRGADGEEEVVNAELRISPDRPGRWIPDSAGTQSLLPDILEISYFFFILCVVQESRFIMIW